MTGTLQAENRLQHVWSTEAYDALTRPGFLWSVKKGIVQREDVSGIEKVQLGKVFEEPIMKAFAARERINFKQADYAMYHPSVAMASHFDFISEDGSTLYEVKNLGVSQKKHYGEAGSSEIHPRYRAQTLHEAACHRINKVVLVVCFGGETIQHFPMDFQPEEIQDHVEAMARFWATVVTDQQPKDLPEEAIRALYPKSVAANVYANAEVTKACNLLSAYKQQIKLLEEQESALKQIIYNFMQDKDTLLDLDNSVLATFKSAKDSTKFDMDAFKEAMPEVYERFLKAVPGSRRFLLK